MSPQREGALLVLREGDRRQEWPLQERTVIGRDPSCAVCLPDRQVSRHHATIHRAAEGYEVTDEGSKNGTWLNGRRLATPTRLTDGDEVSIAARYKLFFVDAEATAPLAFEDRGLRIDAANLAVFVNGVLLDPPLSVPQFELLRALYDADGGLVGRETLVDRIWPYTDGEGVTDDALDALVRRLRLRLAEVDPDHTYVVTARGYGYRLGTP